MVKESTANETNNRKRYFRKEIAQVYDKRRFGGESGRRVDLREKQCVKDLLKDVNGKVLEVACGTGRITEFLLNEGFDVIGLDCSGEMLKIGKKKVNAQFFKSHASHIPMKENCFDAVVAIRFFHHYKNIQPFLTEIKRVLDPGGFLVCDAYKWSLRRNIYFHEEFDSLKVQKKIECFVFSPLIYRILPLLIVEFLNKIEEYLYKVRIFYLLKN